MTATRIRNLIASTVFTVLMLFYVLSYSSIFAIAAAVIGCGLVFLITVITNSDEKNGLLTNLDVYMFFGVVTVIFIKIGGYVKSANFGRLIYLLSRTTPTRLGTFAVSVVLLLVFRKIGADRKNGAPTSLFKFIGVFMFGSALSYLIFGEFTLMIPFFAVNAVSFFAGAMRAAVLKNDNNNREVLLTLLLEVILTLYYALYSVAPSGSAAELRLTLSGGVLTWYGVVIIVAACAAIVGNTFRKNEHDDTVDDVLLAGIASGVILLKSVLYFMFSFNGALIALFVIVWMVLMYRVGEAGKYRQSPVLGKLKLDEMWVVFLLGLAAAAVNIAISAGFVGAALALVFGIVIIVYAPNIFSGWVKDAVRWQLIAAVIAAVAALVMLVTKNNAELIKIAIAMFAVTSAALWMLCWRHEVGRNNGVAAKATVAVLFAILLTAPLLRYGTSVKLSVADGERVGSLIESGASLGITVKARGKGNAVVRSSYYWTDFLTIGGSRRQTPHTSMISGRAQISARTGQLTIESVDKNDVTTRRVFWFYEY